MKIAACREPVRIINEQRHVLKAILRRLMPMSAVLALSALCLIPGNARADSIATVIASASGSTHQITTNPVITQILSQVGTFDGITYTNWSFLVQDSAGPNGSIDIFGALPGGYTPPTSNADGSYTSGSGTTISVTGKNAPFQQIPEMGTITAISNTNAGNAVVPGPVSATVSQLNTNPISGNYAGYVISLTDATISGLSGTFGSTNLTGTVTDGSGSMTLFYWATSLGQSVINLNGKIIPSGPVNMTGIVDVFGSTPEFNPLTITPFNAPPPPNAIYWNPNGGSGLGGSGTWDTVNTTWNANSTPGSSPTVYNSNYGVFAGTGGTVTMASGGITANGGLEFDSSGYHIQATNPGDALTIGTTNTISVLNGSDTATIDAKISGTTGINKTGGGTLVLTNTTNDFTGGVTITNGTISISNDAHLGDPNNGVTLSGGTLKDTFAGTLVLGASRTISGNGGAIDVASGNTLQINGSVNAPFINLANSGTVIFNGSTTLGGLGFATTGTATMNAGTAIMTGGVFANNASGTATINGNLQFDSTAHSIVLNGGTLLINGNVNSPVHENVTGTGTLNISGDASGLAWSMSLGTSGTGGPTVLLHDANGLGTGDTTQPGEAGYMFFNGGTINNGTAGTLTLPTTLGLSIGSRGSGSFAATDAATFAGSALVFPGPLNIFKNNNTTQADIFVNNNTTFSGDWALSTQSTSPTSIGTTPSLFISTGGTGTLTLSGTVEQELPLIVDKLTLNVNTHMTTNPVATTAGFGVTVQNGGTIKNGVTDALPTGAKLTVGASSTSAGTFNLNGNNQTLGGVALVNGTISGTGNTITATGAVQIKITTAGTGYTTAPNVTIGAPPAGGTQATVTANLNSAGGVYSLTITNPGSGYTSAPTITIDPPSSGTTAVATATNDFYDMQSGTVGANLAGGVAMVKSTTGTVTLNGNNSYSGGTTVSAGKLNVGSPTALGTGGLNISAAGANTTLVAGLSLPVQLPSLTIVGGTTPTATLDMTNNNMIVHNGSISTTLAQLKKGLNSAGTLWTGTGITSSTAAADAAAHANATVFAVGAIKNIDQNNNLIYGTWPAPPSPDGGVSGLATTDVLVKYTYFGDANLDGVVDNTSDYDLWSTGFQNPGLAATNGWLYGDFDLSGIVDNTSDYDLWSTGFVHQGSPLAGGASAASDQPSVQSVPEPSSVLLAVAGLAGLAAVARGKKDSPET